MTKKASNRYVALLRAVNLGAGRQVSMPALRELLEGLGMTDVATYVQSGNVVFTTNQQNREVVAHLLEEAIGAEFGFVIPVILLTGAEMAAVIGACPYRAEADSDPTKIHVTFVDPRPPPETWLAIDPVGFAPDVFAVGEGVVYMHLPEGMGRAKLPVRLAKATSDVVATTRNWRTVVNLAEMVGGG